MILSDHSAADENIVVKGGIAHNEQLLILPQCFKLYSISVLSFYREFPNSFLGNVFKAICCRCVVCGNGLKFKNHI